MSYAIAGVTGNTGSVAADTLLSQGKEVRVIVRDRAKGASWAERGAEVAVADLGDREALARALTGVEGAYLLVPPNAAVDDFRGYQRGMVDAIGGAVEDASVPHVVLLSSIGADLPSGNGPVAGLYEAEKRLHAIEDTALTSIRAGYFMENLAMSFSMLDQGVVPSFFPATTPIAMVATVDIGKLAARLLVEGAETSSDVELWAAQPTMKDVADTLAEILGKPVRLQEAPLDAMVPTFTSFGMKPGLAELYREMTAGIISGAIGLQPGARTERAPTPLKTALRTLL